MSRLTLTTTFSLLALYTALGLAAPAQAACIKNVDGSDGHNTCIGANTLANNIVGADFNAGRNNTAIGSSSLQANMTGNSNTAAGSLAMNKNESGSYNVAVGREAMYNTKAGNFNTATGPYALWNNNGNDNTATGRSALYGNLSGNNNTASGAESLRSNSGGSENTGIGNKAGGKQTGSNNTWLGAQAGWRGDFGDGISISGNNNIAVGYQAGSQWTTGSNNIAIGNVGGGNDANTIRIGGTQTTVFFSGIYATKVTKTRPVLINANGQLGTSRSSLRYKEDVHSMGDASNALLDLRPVTYRYKQAEADGSKPVQYGLIAEEVDKVMPDLVVYDEQGRPDSVSYEILPSLLLNEYQKQARELEATKAKLAAAEAKVDSAEARVDSLEAEMAALKLAVSRLAAAPSAVKVAASAP